MARLPFAHGFASVAGEGAQEELDEAVAAVNHPRAAVPASPTLVDGTLGGS